jgi:hypothetical protein
MVNIKAINDREITDRLTDYQTKGGAVRMPVFEISENYLGEMPDEYTAHLITARQTLEKENYECNLHINKVLPPNKRLNSTIAQTDFTKLDPSGQKIDVKDFLGPHFDLANKKPFIRGQLGNETLNVYFYHDQEEATANKIDINKIVEEFQTLYPKHTGGFVHTFMEPPYNVHLGKEIKKRGEYLLDFMDFFFSDLERLIIFTWDTDCSIIFEPGKEWLGSYFWTVYNPVKNWYIGIIASETD